MKVSLADLGRQLEPIKKEVLSAMESVISSSSFIGGEPIKRFEKNFSEAHGCQHTIGVGNGTDALIIALRAVGLQPGQKVLVPANSFVASSEAVTAAGGQVVFVDVNESDFLINFDEAEKLLSQHGDIFAMIPVHLYGRVCDLKRLRELKNKYNLRVIEDAAQAHLGRFDGIHLSEVSDAATFSFFPAKNLGAFGDAGAIVTNSDSLAKKIRMLANHGRVDKYDHEFEGLNSRLDTLHAVVLDIKLSHLEKWTHRKQEIARFYSSQLEETALLTPEIPGFPHHVLHQYVVRHPQRDEIRQRLSDEGVSTGIHYPIALPNLKAYSYLGHKPDDFPVATRLSREIFSLPMFPEITEEELQYVVDKVRSVLGTLKPG